MSVELIAASEADATVEILVLTAGDGAVSYTHLTLPTKA